MSVEAIKRKEEEVNLISEKIDNSVATVVVEYAGLTVEELKVLRKELRQENIEFQVLKNNISKRAFQKSNFNLDEALVGPTAVAFSKEDVTAAARILNNFAKEHEALKLKSGTIEKEIATEAQIRELATLPNRDGMVSMLLSVLQAPIRGLAQTVSQVAEKTEE